MSSSECGTKARYREIEKVSVDANPKKGIIALNLGQSPSENLRIPFSMPDKRIVFRAEAEALVLLP